MMASMGGCSAALISARVLALPLKPICRGSKPASAGLPQLAAGVHLDVDAAAPHAVEEPEVGAGLAGVEHPRPRMVPAEGIAQRRDVALDLRGAEEKERRWRRLGHAGHIDAAEAHAAVLAGEHVLHGVGELGEIQAALEHVTIHGPPRWGWSLLTRGGGVSDGARAGAEECYDAGRMRTARKSFTLVRVGPVTTRSPRAAKRL